MVKISVDQTILKAELCIKNGKVGCVYSYLLISGNCKYLQGTYPNFLKFKDLIGKLSQMVSKQSNTYTYNGEVYVSKLTNAEILKIQTCYDTGEPTSHLEKLKYICMDLGIRSF